MVTKQRKGRHGDLDSSAAVAAASGAANIADLPPQLLFVHQGQRDIKEIHFHPQIPGAVLSTAADSFTVFKPAI